ncbi:hypothetical protein C7H11_02560 [Escherichia coli]|nr:hypothetical protein C7H11_02560 [Escherichia coli]
MLSGAYLQRTGVFSLQQPMPPGIKPPQHRCGAEPFTAVGLGGCMLPAAVSAGRGASWLCAD